MRQGLIMTPDEKRFYDSCYDPANLPILITVLKEIITSQEGREIVTAAVSKEISEYRYHQRLSLLETYTGLDVDTHCVGSDFEWDEMEPVERMMYKDRKKIVVQPLPDQLTLISERINDSSIPVLHETETIFSGNDTEIRAKMLRKKMENAKYKNGIRQMNSKDVAEFLQDKSQVGEQVYEGKYPRKAANDVMKKAGEMFPNELNILKNKGNINVLEFKEKRQRLP